MAERTPHEVWRGEVKVTTLDDSSWVQRNPTMRGATSWQFAIVDGTFQATGSTESYRDGKKAKTTKQVLRWDGKQLSAPAPSPRPRTSGK